jgi:hypothetical protein
VIFWKNSGKIMGMINIRLRRKTTSVWGSNRGRMEKGHIDKSKLM